MTIRTKIFTDQDRTMSDLEHVIDQLRPYVRENLDLHKRIRDLQETIVKQNGWIEERDRAITDLRH